MFDRFGMIVATHPSGTQDAEEAAIEANAQEVEKTDDGYQFLCDVNDLAAVSKSLQGMGWQLSASEFTYVPKSYVDLTEEQKKEVTAFLEGVDDNDDVHRIYVAMK